MAKVKSAFFCQQCGYETPKWTGKCPSCNAWNTLVEEIVRHDDKIAPEKIWQDDTIKISKKAHKIDDISTQQELRMITPDSELNR
nr:DNA repair protein RadA [Flavipsychrobacter sp.]